MLVGGADTFAPLALAAAAAWFLVAGVTAAAWPGHRPTMIAVTIACVLLAVGGSGLIVGPSVAFRAGDVLGYALIDVRYDGLAGLFLIVLGVVGAAASVYGIGYHDGARSRMDPMAHVLFLASMALVFGSASAFSFLFAWEAMAIASAFLVIGSRPSRAVAKAGYVYLVMTHVATAAIAVAFAAWSAAAGSLDFSAWGAAAATMDGRLRDLLFVLLLIGFGTKAGMMPLHIWLPRAHPVAPSHISAVMSGVMIKTGIFGIIRFAIEFLGPGPAWWGLLVLVIGAASAVLGVLYALAEHDLKRLLAFSSIENVGIILVGIGVALIGVTEGAAAIVVLALAAALFHTFNHALFKGLLFLGAGAVQAAAHTRDLNRLGGMARVMPLTALAFAVGAAAISGLPPLNGFASEWLTIQALLGAGGHADLDPLLRFACYLAIGAIALTAALSVAAFVKATGMTFLALPRSPAATRARNVGRSMRGAMVVLALSCAAVGVGAGPIGTVMGRIAGSVGGRSDGPLSVGRAPITLGVYEPVIIVFILAVLFLAITTISRVRAGAVRRAPTWTCGINPEPVFEYTATSFSKPLRLFFEPVLRPDRELLVEFHDGGPFPKRVTYRSETDHVIETRLYGPLHRISIAFSQAARRLQQGTLQLYLAYTVGALVILLLLFRG